MNTTPLIRFPRTLPRAATVVALALSCATLCGAQSAPPTGAKLGPVFQSGQAQEVPEFKDPKDWIKQELWVETEFDSDGDGKKDRMHVDVTRPKQTDEGVKLAVIYASSPYYAGTSGPRAFLWNVQQEVGVEPPPRTSQPVVAYKADRTFVSNDEVTTWVPRGFIVVHSEAPGTGLSQGCPTVGNAPEQLAPKAVIDWLNGRAKGYTSRTSTEEVKATWTTGKVGMTGTSYNGTIPLAAAVTGVKGLEAIIPIAPNTSYYHYYRSNGLVRHPGGWLGEDIDFLYDFIYSGDPAFHDYCNRTYRDGLYKQSRDRAHGDYNDFWADRDLMTKIGNVKAATLLAQGENDWNVVPEHSIRIYEALKKQKTPAMLYLHQGGHGGPPTMELRNRWFSHYLYDVDNGVDKDPRSYIVREGGGRGSLPTPYADYPNPGAVGVRLSPVSGGNSVGSLSLDAAKATLNEKLVDDVQFSGSTLANMATSQNRLLYATPTLKDTVHMSGTVQVTLRLASSKPAANLSVWLVQIPFDSTPIGSSGLVGLVTRGWADPQNYKSLKGGNYNSKLPGEPLAPGKFYDMTFDLQPADHVIAPGKKLALMIMSSDRDFTLWPKAGTELTIDVAHSSVLIPFVGGAAAYKKATVQ